MGKTGYYEKLDKGGIRKRIKEIRAKIKIDGVSVNQEKFMEMVNPGYYATGGSGQKQMSQWENADPLPPVDVLLAIARAGNVSLDWLLYGKGDAANAEKICTWRDMAFCLAVLCHTYGANIEITRCPEADDHQKYSEPFPRKVAQIAIPIEMYWPRWCTSRTQIDSEFSYFLTRLENIESANLQMQPTGLQARKFALQAINEALQDVPADPL